MKFSSLSTGLFLVIAFLFSQQSLAADSAVLTTASGGYDVVAYQTQDAAVKGTTSHFAYHDGQAYLFSSKENREIFEKNPEKYVPAYGGYCAMGIALGRKFPVDPEAFYVVDGTTYLNLNKTVQSKWLEAVSDNISKANTNWKEVGSVDPAKL